MTTLTTVVTEMVLNRSGREYYTLEFTVTDIAGNVIDDAGPWEASFDGDTTWSTGIQDAPTGYWQWLVAGADADLGDAVAVITADELVPIARLVDTPEIVARNMPPIVLQD